MAESEWTECDRSDHKAKGCHACGHRLSTALFADRMSFKRPRTPTRSSSSDSDSPTLEPTAKSTRTNKSSARPLLCTLPPTCNPPRNQPTHIANSRELETHYATYHAHVCEYQGCGCVFPDAKLLELVSLRSVLCIISRLCAGFHNFLCVYIRCITSLCGGFMISTILA